MFGRIYWNNIRIVSLNSFSLLSSYYLLCRQSIEFCQSIAQLFLLNRLSRKPFKISTSPVFRMTVVESPPPGGSASPTPPPGSARATPTVLPSPTGTPTPSGDLSPTGAQVPNERKVSTCNGPKPFPVRGLNLFHFLLLLSYPSLLPLSHV